MATCADIAIVGGGVIGLTLARQLRTEGHAVCLLERHECGREASWAGAGILAPCNPQRRDPLFHFQERSLELFPQLCGELQQETGIDVEYERCGELELIFSRQAMGIARADERGAAGKLTCGGKPRVEFLTPDQLGAMEPSVTDDLLGALLCRHTAQVRNPRLLAALRRSCELRGVNIREHTRALDVMIEGGKVVGISTDQGESSCGAVVICAGAWSGTIGQHIGPALPVHPVRGQIILLKLACRPFQHIIARGKTYLVPRRDGHLIIGSTEEPEAGFVKRNTPQGTTHLLERAQRFVPALANAPVLAMWSGLRPGTRDDKPLMGAVPHLSGLYAATGHFRSGLTNAPATGEFISALLAGRTYPIDLSYCAPKAHGDI